MLLAISATNRFLSVYEKYKSVKLCYVFLTHFKLKSWIAANVVKKQQQNGRERNSEQMEINLRIGHEKK